MKEDFRLDFSSGKNNPFKKGAVTSISAADAAGGG